MRSILSLVFFVGAVIVMVFKGVSPDTTAIVFGLFAIAAKIPSGEMTVISEERKQVIEPTNLKSAD